MLNSNKKICNTVYKFNNNIIGYKALCIKDNAILYDFWRIWTILSLAIPSPKILTIFAILL